MGSSPGWFGAGFQWICVCVILVLKRCLFVFLNIHRSFYLDTKIKIIILINDIYITTVKTALFQKLPIWPGVGLNPTWQNAHFFWPGASLSGRKVGELNAPGGFWVSISQQHSTSVQNVESRPAWHLRYSTTFKEIEIFNGEIYQSNDYHFLFLFFYPFFVDRSIFFRWSLNTFVFYC